MTPNIDDIRRDDELLDTLGQRRAPHRPDAAADALAGWVREIDAPTHAPAPGRYARSRHTRTKVGVVAAITVATLSISGVAAAVGGMPGISSVAQQLGFVHRSSEFGSGAAGPTSTSAASTAAASTSDVATYDVTTQSSTSTSALPPRVLPGALRRASAVAEQTHHPTPSITSASTTPSSTSTPSSSSSSTSSKPSSTPSSTATSTTEPSPTSTHTKRPPTPRPTHTRTTPGWGPISPTSTPSSTSESSTPTTGSSTTP